MAMTSKAAFGAKEDIETAKSNNTIDEYDILYLNNQEIGWIDKNGDTVISTVRTQNDIEINGVTGLGMNNGDTIPAGKSFDEIIKMLVQKPISPTYNQPTVSLAKSGSGTTPGSYEAGTSITPVLTATFTKNDAGNLTKLAILKESEEVSSDSTSPHTYTGSAFILGDETVSFKAQATYGDGAIKNNNLGTPDATGQIKAGSKTSSTLSFVGQRNLFWGTGVGDLPTLNSSTIRGLTNKKLNPTQGYSWNIPIAVGQQYVIIAYRSTLRDINEIMYVETNDTGMVSSFTKTTVNVADARGGENNMVEYKVYTYRMAAPAAAAMTFKVTI